MRLTMVTAPTARPLTEAEALDHVRVSPDGDIAHVMRLVSAVTSMFEVETGRQLMQATYRLRLDGFPRHRMMPIELPKPPLSSVTSVTFVDDAGDIQTWDNSLYMTDSFAGEAALPGIVYPRPGVEYPIATSVPDAVIVEFVAGYATAADVPDGIKATLLLMLGDLYENREAQITGTMVTSNATLTRMLGRYRLPVLA